MSRITATVDLEKLSAAPSKTETENAARTHKTIREYLESVQNLNRYHVDTYLQGSYKNSTNVRQDSEVDINSRTAEVYIGETEKLSQTQRSLYESKTSVGGFTFQQYRSDVLAALRAKYQTVYDGNKAITIPGNSSRLNADVLPCVEYRYYWNYTGRTSDYSKGIAFYSKQGKLYVNFPDQHYENLTSKNGNTGGKLKGCVRIFKRIRNAMVEEGTWRKERSPSYYLECLLWNVPTHIFSDSYEIVVPDVLKYLYTDLKEIRDGGDLRSYKQANDIYVLFHSEFWNVGDAIDFVSQVWDYIYRN